MNNLAEVLTESKPKPRSYFESYREWFHEEHCYNGTCRNPKCTQPVVAGDWMLCAKCTVRFPKGIAHYDKVMRDKARETIRLDAKRAVEQLPLWHQQRTFEELRGCLAKSLLPIADRFVPGEMSMVVAGKSGDGKTGGVAASIKRITGRITDDEFDVEPDEVWRLQGLMWTTAHDLVRARREAPLGAGDAQAIIAAKRALALVIDELGQEPASEIPFEIIDHRYENARSTIVTTGLRPAEFQRRYGEACWRRLTEKGVGCLFSTFDKGKA